MSCPRELPTIRHTVTLLSTDLMYVFEDRWWPGIPGTLDFVGEIENIVQGTGGAAVECKPALQTAAVRSDRPDAPGLISAGSAITAAATPTHYEETPSLGSKNHFRRGWGCKLTSGSLAVVSLRQHTSAPTCGQVLAPVMVVVDPLNAGTDIVLNLISPVLVALNVSKVKAALVFQDNVNDKLEWRLHGRAFNDRAAPGAWTALGSGWTAPASGDSELNTGEIDLVTALSLSSYQWLELALGTRKTAGGDPNSRCNILVHPIVTFT